MAVFEDFRSFSASQLVRCQEIDPAVMMLIVIPFDNEYSRVETPQVRQAGNRLSGLTETAYASLLA